jgi:hypothetical protein
MGARGAAGHFGRRFSVAGIFLVNSHKVDYGHLFLALQKGFALPTLRSLGKSPTTVLCESTQPTCAVWRALNRCG